MLIAAGGEPEYLRRCVESARTHTQDRVPIFEVAATAVDVNQAFQRLAPADVVVLDEPCLLTPGWLQRLGEAARADTNTATASALADSGGELALAAEPGSGEDLAQLADRVARQGLRLHPRLGRAVGPCVYVRRESLDLVGALDEQLDLRWALEVDFAQRCLLAGLSHVAADDVLVGRLGPAAELGQPPAPLLERYPYLQDRKSVV